jgi:hypothetical protein
MSDFIVMHNKYGNIGMPPLHLSFFHRTQRGGFVSEIDDKTKLVPIERWDQRRMMHVSGKDENIFNGEMKLKRKSRQS